MGPSKSPHSLPKISKVGVGSVVLVVCILFAGVENVNTKSIPEPELSLLSEDSSTPSQDPISSSSPESSEVPPPASSPPGSDRPDELTKLNPWRTLTLNSDSPQQRQFKLGNDAKDEGFRIAVHLKTCNFPDTEKIQIQSGGESRNWNCPNQDNSKEAEDSNETFDENQERHHQNGLENVFPHRVLDGLEEISISHTFGANPQSKAIIAINIYKDLSGSGDCPSKYFNCYRELCPSKCCSDYSSSGREGGGNQNRQMSYTLSQIPDIFTSKASKPTRCIPEQLLCDGNPSCGLSENIDERNEVCHPKEYCMDCQTLCLTWNYVLTSLAIAVLFIITPTAIVFALFHRRNVALERARLTRMAQMRMTDMRGEFTRDDPVNDLPPSYEEVHDIKVPPPCFCRAVSMDQAEADQNENGNEPGNDENSEICSCRNRTTEEDKPPETSSDSASESNNNTEVGIDAVKAIDSNSNPNCDTENK